MTMVYLIQLPAGGAGTYLLDYTYTDNNGCTNVANINVDVAAPPKHKCWPGYQYLYYRWPYHTNWF